MTKLIAYLDVTTAEDALVENEGLGDKAGLRELDIRIPAYAPSASICYCAALAR